ncbi:MAG: CvpA family protein [Candidatus Latescibacterota bacterium]
MSAVDIILLVLIGASALYGAARGGVKEIFSILAIIGGIAGGIYLHGPVAQAFGGSGVVHVVGFAVIFLVIAFALHKIGGVIRTGLKLMFLGGLDRILGAGIGLVRGLVLVGLIWGLMSTYVDGSKQWIEDSKLASPTLRAVEVISPVFPGSLRDRFEGKQRALKDSWEQLMEKTEGARDLLEKTTGAKEVWQKVEEIEEKVRGK